MARLEAGGLPLEESIALYERGVALHDHCARLLTRPSSRPAASSTARRRAPAGRPAARTTATTCRPWSGCATCADREDLKGISHAEARALCRSSARRIIDTVAETGGHLGSSLGVVELTVALHRLLDSPTDRIVWDTGHQAYAHKLLTGRLRALRHAAPAGRRGRLPAPLRERP